MAEGTFCRSVPSALPAPRQERRGGHMGKHVKAMNPMSRIDDPHNGFGPPNTQRVYGGVRGGGMSGGLLKGMSGKRL